MLQYGHLLGLEFRHGSRDCYEIIRDFYRDNFGIRLRSYARPDLWWEQGLDLYQSHYTEEGFSVVDRPEIGDVILMAVNSEVPNHGAVYLGNNKILHHFMNRRSEECMYKGLWKNTTCVILHHKDVHVVSPRTLVTLDELEKLRTSKQTS